MEARPSPFLRHPLFILMAVSFLLIMYGLLWGLPNLYDFAQDSVVPQGNLAQVHAPFEKVTAFRYPPFHFLLLRACFLPARGLLQISSLSENAKVASTLFILTARLASVAMALGALGFIYAAGRRLWDERVGRAAALLFVLSPVALYYAKNANLDIPYLFWLSLVLFFYVRIMQENRRRDYLWLGLSAALAVCTKDQAYGFILLMPIVLLVHLRARLKLPLREFLPQALKNFAGPAALGFAVPFVAIHNILFDPAGFWRHVSVVIGPGSEGWRQFQSGPLGQLRLLAETLLRLSDAWTAAGVALAVYGLIVAFREDGERRTRLATLVPVISYHLSFLAVIGYVYPRFVLPMLLVLALFAGRGAASLWRGGRLGQIAVAALIGWIGLAGLCVDYVMSEYPRYDAQKWLEAHASAETKIFYVGEMRDMPRFNRPLDAHPVEPTPKAIAALRPPADLLVLSFEQGSAAAGTRSFRISSILRRHLGDWGLIGKEGGKGFLDRLAAGEFGYAEAARFESPISAFMPEVAESLDRTIVILGRKGT
jgi:4-amino-4-deoxy-L-arabinose transferase-like glycosyltransferase